jgi:hypothetical protein
MIHKAARRWDRQPNLPLPFGLRLKRQRRLAAVEEPTTKPTQ